MYFLLLQRFPQYIQNSRLKLCQFIQKQNTMMRQTDFSGMGLLSTAHQCLCRHRMMWTIWFGLTWSLELYQQTNARLWRQGQQSKTVIIQHIITTGTIDRKIMSALQKKEETQNALIDAVKAELGGKK